VLILHLENIKLAFVYPRDE